MMILPSRAATTPAATRHCRKMMAATFRRQQATMSKLSSNDVTTRANSIPSCASSRFLSSKMTSWQNTKAAVSSTAAVPGTVGFPSGAQPPQSQRLLRYPYHRSFHSSAAVEFPVRRRRRHRASSLEASEHKGEAAAAASANAEDEESGGFSSTNTTMNDTASSLATSLTDADFLAVADSLLDKLERALWNMAQRNDMFLVSRHHGDHYGDMGPLLQIDLSTGMLYQIEFSIQEQVFEYSSPVSGKILYEYDSRHQTWIGVDDGHAFEGILVRDLIRQGCQGLPDL